MTLKANEAKSGSSIEIMAIGNYPARLVQIIDLGVQHRQPFKGKAKSDCNMIRTTYEFPTEFLQDEDGEDDLEKPRFLSEKLNLFSMSSENATSTARMKGIDPTNEFDGDWEMALEQACTVTVVHSKTGEYANIGAVSPEMKGMTTPPLVNEAKIFTMEDPDMDWYEDMPAFIKKELRASLDYEGSALEAELIEAGEEEGEEKPKPKRGKGKAKKPKPTQVEEDLDDEIPY